MNQILKRVIEAGIIVVSLIPAFLVFRRINPEKVIKPDNNPVTAVQIAAAPQKSYTGKVAGEDIMRISNEMEYEEAVGTVYMTVEPQAVVSTGIYSLNPWVDPYKITKMRNSGGRMVSSGRKAPEVTDSSIQAMEYYQEYYLVELPDQTYVLAQFSSTYKEKIERGEAVTLPIGVKKANSSTARGYLKEICEKYGADSTFTLYMIDDKWQEEHEFTFFIIKFAVAAVVFLALAVTLLTIVEKKQR